MKKLVSVVFLTTAMLAGIATASAAKLEGFTGSSATVRVTINGDIATVTGWVEDYLDLFQAGNAAAKLDGVNEVRNLIQVSK